MFFHPVLFQDPKSVSGASIGFKDKLDPTYASCIFIQRVCCFTHLLAQHIQKCLQHLLWLLTCSYHLDLLADLGSVFTFGAGVCGAFSFSRSFWRFLSIALMWFRNGLSHMLLVSRIFAPVSGHKVSCEQS